MSLPYSSRTFTQATGRTLEMRDSMHVSEISSRTSKKIIEECGDG